MSFEILEVGPFSAERVRCVYTDSPRPPHPDVEPVIERVWAERIREARATGVELYDGPQLRLLDWTAGQRADRRSLSLRVGPGSYRDFLGTNLSALHRSLPSVPLHHFGNVLGTSALLSCSDASLVLGRRSERVAFYAGWTHCVGGTVEGVDRQPDGRVDVFASILREVEEEVGVAPAEARCRCLGLVRDESVLQPELVFEVSVDLSFEELSARWAGAEARAEHAELIALPARADAVVRFTSDPKRVTPVALAALQLWGGAQEAPDAESPESESR